MDLFVNPFSGGSHKNNMGYRVNGQVGDQILVVNAPVHAADEDGAYRGDALQCLNSGIADGGDGVVIETDSIFLTDQAQTVGKWFITDQSLLDLAVTDAQCAADRIYKCNIQMVVVSQQRNFICGNLIIMVFKMNAASG